MSDLTTSERLAVQITESGRAAIEALQDTRALDRCISLFTTPRTHGERVTLAQLKAKREALR